MPLLQEQRNGQAQLGQANLDEQDEGQDEQKPKTPDESRKAYVKEWVKKCKQWEVRYEKDFKRMRENMAFISSLQYPGQKEIKTKRYVANFVNRLVNMKLSSLYARNPKATATRRKRLDFTLWNGHVEDLMQAGMAVQNAMSIGGMPPPQAWALLQDWEKGMERREIVKKIGEVIEIVYQYQIDTQEPEFKSQMKQLVWRTCVCGVAYVRMSFCREYESELTFSETRTTVTDRIKTAKGILDKLEETSLQDNDPKIEQLRVLIESIQSEKEYASSKDPSERLVYDFLPSTSVIPDEHCRSLRDFVGAHAIAIIHILPLDYVNSFFSVDIKAGGFLVNYSKTGQENDLKSDPGSQKAKPHVKLFEVIDRDSKTSFIVCDGHDDYVQEPQPLDPPTRRFWPVFALTFNHVETEGECEASVFPPSDVDLMKSAQKERNEARESRSKHRKANKPQYLSAKGSISDTDKDGLIEGEANEVIELNVLDDVSKAIVPLNKIPMDPMLYDDRPSMDDALITTGIQEANLGQVQPNTTATGNTIAEQSRTAVAASDVDTLDDMLSAMAEAGGEIILYRFSPETVKRIAGEGAPWFATPDGVNDFCNEIYLQIMAASSGRPNKAIDVATWERLAPLILQAAQMPPQLQKTIQAVIRETIKRADDQLEPSDFFPDPMPLSPTPQETNLSQPQTQQAMPQQPLQQMPMGAPPVPLMAA